MQHALNFFFFNSHVDFPPNYNCDSIRNKHRNRFHQDIADMERRYLGGKDKSMLTYHSSTVAGKTPVDSCKRSVRKRQACNQYPIVLLCFS
ncbi:hypothetical protein NPIL_264861 [Nephila pilipes]|uniref:Uncharacterized protein n=1 Tax=Nephila pilipes TaxID=299642 RepID=A0A8X6TP74_NEPPI|nr:hypothetical protein NPIL_264861 [Nephila pilipes]